MWLEGALAGCGWASWFCSDTRCSLTWQSLQHSTIYLVCPLSFVRSGVFACAKADDMYKAQDVLTLGVGSKKLRLLYHQLPPCFRFGHSRGPSRATDVVPAALRTRGTPSSFRLQLLFI